MKPIVFTITIYFVFQLLTLQSLACGTTIEGPSYACPTTEIEYTVESPKTADGWTWSCVNCEVFDPEVSQWVTSYTHYSTELAYQYTNGRTDVQMGASGANSTLSFVEWDDAGSTSDSHVITLSAPGTSAGLIGGPSTLQNCDNSDIRLTLLPANSWFYQSWSAGSGLTIDASTSTYADVSATSTTATGIKTVTANLRWRDAGNTTCGSKNIYKSIRLTGDINSNNISMSVYSSGTSAPNTICDSGAEGEEELSVSYNPGSADSWQWSFPSGWSYTSASTSGNAYTITSAPSSGNVGVRATNECGTSAWKYFYIYTVDCGGGMEELMLGPNPNLTEAVVLSIEPTATVEAKANLESQDFTVDIYKDATLIRSNKGVKINDQIAISDLKSGTYIFKVIGKSNQIDRQIIIQ